MNYNLASRTEVRELLRKYEFHVRKKFGQNFLVDENILQKIVKAAELSGQSQVLEIGPGLGSLTVQLAEQAKMVVAIEIDRALKPILDENLSSTNNVKLIIDDALKIDFNSVFDEDGERFVVANLPYYITTPLVVKMLELEPKAKRIVVLVQREVGERLMALPGTAAYGSLSVLAQVLAEVKAVGVVPRQVFYPIPDVESMIVSLDPKDNATTGVKSKSSFELTNRALFGQRRKTLANALKGSPHWRLAPEDIDAALKCCQIDPGGRGEQLAPEDIVRLANALTKYLPHSPSKNCFA